MPNDKHPQHAQPRQSVFRHIYLICYTKFFGCSHKKTPQSICIRGVNRPCARQVKASSIMPLTVRQHSIINDAIRMTHCVDCLLYIQTIRSASELHWFLRASQHARGLYHRSGISPCPEGQYLILDFRFTILKQVFADFIISMSSGMEYPASTHREP